MSGDEVFEREITVGNTMGLHARPAAQLVRIASAFDASMSVEKIDGDEDGEADCRSVLSLLMLAAGKGTRLILRASGPQAEAAFRAAVEFFESNFGEEE
ncbi:MAG: HPr family phosphocarrier protein [Lentisphaeria bacterium]|nr:HPr family phosphocarrier protein [Lentisphaeria bacterium]